MSSFSRMKICIQTHTHKEQNTLVYIIAYEYPTPRNHYQRPHRRLQK
jgi:hypothetical protein